MVACVTCALACMFASFQGGTAGRIAGGDGRRARSSVRLSCGAAWTAGEHVRGQWTPVQLDREVRMTRLLAEMQATVKRALAKLVACIFACPRLCIVAVAAFTLARGVLWRIAGLAFQLRLSAEAELVSWEDTRATVAGMTSLLALMQAAVEHLAALLTTGALFMHICALEILALLAAPASERDKHSTRIAWPGMTEHATGMSAFSFSAARLATGMRRHARPDLRIFLSPAETSVSLRQVLRWESRVARRAAPLDQQLRLQLGPVAQVTQ